MRLRVAQRRSWPWWTVSIVTGLACIVWIAAFPVLGTKPLYLCDSSKTDWTGTFSEPLVANGKRVATLLFLADPLRKSKTFHLLAHGLAGQRLRGIRATIKGQQQYYEMPLISALRKSVPTSSASAEQETLIEVVYQGLSAGIGVMIVDDNLLVDEGVGISHGPVVYSASRASTPWQTIYVSSSEQGAFRYAAALDFALTAASDGDYSTALASLDNAGIHAPSALERARALTIMAKLSSMVLGDSVGALQALTLDFEAYRTWRGAVSTSGVADDVSGHLAEWIKGELTTAFEQYGSAYPEVAKVLGFDSKTVREAEALRFQKERGKPIADPAVVDAMMGGLKHRLRQYLSSNNAQNWFEAERERMARLDSKALRDEAKQAVSRGPDEARWFAEMLIDSYAGGLADRDDHGISSAIQTAAEGCTEPWRSQLKDYVSISERLLSTMGASADHGRGQLALSIDSAQGFGLRRTGKVFQGILAAASSQTPEAAGLSNVEPRPPVAWWTTEYIDWFLATMWNSSGKCATPSPLCEQELASRREYICFDGSERHGLFAPGLGLAMWMLAGQTKIDPSWDHEFYFGTGTHFALWQRGLRTSHATAR